MKTKPANPSLIEPRSSNSRTRLFVIAFVALVTLAAGAMGGRWLIYRSRHVVVTNAEVKGTIARLGARLDGQVKAILANPGERVTKGQVLVRLEDQHLQAALQLAQAEFASASNNFYCEQIAIEEEHLRLPMEVERAKSILQSAVAVLEGAQSEAVGVSNKFERINTLHKEGMAATSDLDMITAARGKAQADVKSAASLREAAQSSLQSTKQQLDALRVREAHLGVLQAQISVARAQVAAAEADLETTLLRAPEDGWVVERIVELGGSAKVGEPMMSLWIGSPWVEAWASEKALSHIQIGSQVRVSLDAFPSRPLRGRVEAFGLLTDKELLTRPVPTTLDSLVFKGAMVRVCIALENDDDLRLQPGLSAVVGIEKSSLNLAASEPGLRRQLPQEKQVFAASRPIVKVVTTKKLIVMKGKNNEN